MQLVPTFRQAGTAALFSRGAAIAAGFASSLLLPLALDQKSIGQYFLSQLVIAGLATFCQLGLTYTIPGSLTEAAARNDLGKARKLAAVTVILCAAAGLLIALVTAIAAPQIAGIVDPVDRLTWIAILPLVGAIAPLVSMTALLTELLRAVHSIRAAANLSALASLSTAAYAAFTLLFGIRASLTGALSAVLLGSAACVVIGFALFGSIARYWPDTAHHSIRTGALLRRTFPNLLTTLVLFGLANVDMMLLSSLGNIREVAEYGLALRFSALLLVPLAIANSAGVPLAMRARSIGDTSALRDILSGVIAGGAGMAGILFAGLAACGYSFIGIWNPNYQNAYWLMLILGVGNIFHACGGSAGVLLMTWGDQSRALVITLVTSALTVVLCIIGYRFIGMFGIAVASAFGNAFQVAWFVVRVRQTYGLDPSIVGWIQRRP